MRTVIVDTGAIYALVMGSDKNHEPARRFLQHLLIGEASLLLHEWVFVVALTLLKCEAIVTHNVRDFAGAEDQFQVAVWTPQQALQAIGGTQT